MNALVSYDSSSDDDSPTNKAPETKPSAIQYQSSTASLPGSTQAEIVNTKPMVGPSLAPDTTETYEEYEEDSGFGPSMSERDIIRYLTQASHPMTEMPSSPPHSPDAAVSAKFRRFLALKAEGTHFNKDLAGNDGFKNPSLLLNLMQKADLDGQSEYMTSLPAEVFDGISLPAHGYKEALLKSQQTILAQDEAEKKALSTSGKRTMVFSSAGNSEVPDVNTLHGGLQKRQKQ